MRHITFGSFCILTSAIFTSSQLSALELNQAIESCRASNGKPAYMACKQSGGTHEACFGKARSIVQSCVKSAMTAARPKAALFSAEKLSAPPITTGKPSSAEIANDAAKSLVAPPRTVSDISAILDQQKPDPTEVAKLKKLCVEAGRDYNRLQIAMFAPVVEGEPRRVREQYQEAGAHQLIFILDSPAPDVKRRRREA